MTRPKPSRNPVPRYGPSLRPIEPLRSEVAQWLRDEAEALGETIPDEWLETAPATPAPIAGSPVARLLANPTAIRDERDSRQWPNAADLQEQADAIAARWRDWLEERAELVGGVWKDPWSRERALLDAVTGWDAPFPIGRECPEWTTGDGAFAAMRDLMPFDCGTHAGLILPDGEHSWFVLVEPVPAGIWRYGEFHPVPNLWVYTGTMALTVGGKPRKRCEAWRWVRWLANKTVREGNRRTDRQGLAANRQKWTHDFLLDQLFAYRDDHGPDAPLLNQFLNFLLRDRGEDFDAEDAWKRFRRDTRTDWPTLKAQVFPPTEKS